MIRAQVNRSSALKVDKAGNIGRFDVEGAYSKALGVRGKGLTPEFLNPEFKPEWEAFVKNYSSTSDLATAVGFLSYCQALRIDPISPHFTFRDPATGLAKITLPKIEKAIAQAELRRTHLRVEERVRTAGLSRYFKAVKGKQSFANSSGRRYMVCVDVLELRDKRLPLDALLPLMADRLYVGTKLPAAFAPKFKQSGKTKKDLLPHHSTLMTGAGLRGWYRTLSDPNIEVALLRTAGDRILVKTLVSFRDLPFCTKLDEKTRAALWSKFKLI